MSESSRPRLLFAACRPPFPLQNGARIRTYQLLSGLARSFDVTFLTFLHQDGSPDGACTREELNALLGGLPTVTVGGAGPHKRAEQAASLLGRRSWSLGRYHRPAFSAILRREHARAPAAIVHFDDPGLALDAPLPGALNVYGAHNVEHEILQMQSATGDGFRRFFNTVEARKVAREERHVWRAVDLCLAVSERDAATMRTAGARQVEVCPNGVDPVERLPLRPRGEGDPLRLVFVGSGNYAPYERGLAWLVREVMPRLSAKVAVELNVVGTPPARPLAAAGVRYVGRVPSVAPFYEAAHAAVVPVFEGSGTRLKVIEAAAYGRPVVSTALGAEGLPLVADEHYLLADSSEQFATALLDIASMLREPLADRLERMVAGARQATFELTWPRIVEQLAALYLAELDTRGKLPDAHARAARPGAR